MQLNKHYKHSYRFHIIYDDRYNVDNSKTDPNTNYCIAQGVKKHKEYSNYLSLEDFFTNTIIPKEAKENCKKILIERGYVEWLKKENFL